MKVDLGRIIVADDHPVFRSGLISILADISETDQIDEAGSFDELLEQARTGDKPGLMVLDLNFPGMDIAKAVPLLRTEFPLASLIVVSMADDRSSTDRIMAAGVDGFISKAATDIQMRDAFIAVSEGEFVNVSIATGLAAAKTSSHFDRLTPRQLDVLRLVAEGQSNKEIARVLDISPFTVRIHVSAVLRELGVETRSAAAAIAVKYGA